MLGFSWKAIGRGVGISAKQAKKRFYYGVQRAYEELTKDYVRRAGQRERE
jgi:hypothetical protein